MARYAAIFSGGADNDAMVFWNAGAIGTGFYFKDFPTGIYFDGIRLDNPEPFWEDRSPVTSETELLSGAVSMQSAPSTYERPIRVSFRCHASVHHSISLLRAKGGELGTLLIDEFTYENCRIVNLREHEWFKNKFEYEILIAQDTS
ncbi:MAG: hypothetical protein U9R21_08840 [Candidatus Thermoplasmatota archaeon]|nr:hypothetical protein [Candidatus Thermoplasmatota archaeon]